ncbi:MAG TPA: hypothetical protein VMY37_17070, partial [Thermoguttaceae bacterium]|nr:hypothetical protein [Thermoguttaceae bacterium]
MRNSLPQNVAYRKWHRAAFAATFETVLGNRMMRERGRTLDAGVRHPIAPIAVEAEDMETWGTFLCYFVAVLAISWLLVSTLWVSRAAEKEQKAKEEWFEKRLAKTDWKVERDVRPLRSLDIPPGCRRQYPRWSQVRLVSVCKSDQWTGWFFRLKPVLVSVKYDVVMCVLQSSRFDFPRITLKNKVHLRRWFPPRSSGHINDFYPSLCQHWVVHTQDEGQRTLSLLADLKEVLQQVRH